MAGVSTITVPLDRVAAAITESVRAVLTAHGLIRAGVEGLHLCIVKEEDLRALLGELGRNTAQALVALEITEKSDDELRREALVARLVRTAADLRRGCGCGCECEYDYRIHVRPRCGDCDDLDTCATLAEEIRALDRGAP